MKTRMNSTVWTCGNPTANDRNTKEAAMKTRMNSIVRTCGIVTAATLAIAAPAHAGVVNYGGLFAGVQTNAPSNLDLRVGKKQDNTRHYAYLEKYNVVLPQNVKYHAFLPGLYDQNSDLVSAVIPFGGQAKVNSIIVHFDPTAIGGKSASGFIDFDRPIYVITHPNKDLDSSDGTLGVSTWSYAKNLGDRGYDLASKDKFTLSNPSKGIWRIDFTANASTGMDEFRIVEMVSTPAPGSLALLGLGGLLAARRRRA